jgi:hypothetical protein
MAPSALRRRMREPDDDRAQAFPDHGLGKSARPEKDHRLPLARLPERVPSRATRQTFGAAHCPSDDEVYAITACPPCPKDATADDLRLSKASLSSVPQPDESDLIDDDRMSEPRHKSGLEPLMAGCAPDPAAVARRTAVRGATPGVGGDREGLIG